MPSTNKTELGLNLYIGSDKPNMADYNNDNLIITEKLLEKVNKENGKGLSTNDFTNTEKSKLDSISDILSFSFTKDLTTDWQDVMNLDVLNKLGFGKGSYIIQLTCSKSEVSLYDCYYTGIISIYPVSTNSTESDEIVLHYGGYARNDRILYLRTLSHTNGLISLQIACSMNISGVPFTIKFKKLI